MIQIVTAIYEKGVLRPLQPVDLQEHDTVRIQILPENNPNARAWAALIAAGIVLPRQDGPEPAGEDDVSDEQLQQIAEELGALGPVSTYIIEDRGEL
jgi:hypothetical protein